MKIEAVLAAIALQTGRAKDKARLLQFLEAGALDPDRFQTILQRLAALSIGEKFRMLDELRERALALVATRRPARPPRR